MKIKKIKKKNTEVITDIICDCCGESCKVNIGGTEKKPITQFEYMTLSANWGYGSGKDLEGWEAHLCEKCVDKKLGFVKFKNIFIP